MKRLDVILSIIAGALVLAFSVTLAVMTVRGFSTPFSSAPYATPTPYEPYGDDSPLATGDAGSPVALAPTECPTACFTWGHLAAVALTAGPYHELGLYPSVATDIDQTESTAAAEYPEFVEDWSYYGTFADECFFTSPYAPIAEGLDAVGVPEDPIAHIGGGTAADQGANLEQWARVFPDTASAVEYMAMLDAGLDACTLSMDANSYPTDVILRQAAIDVPDSVAALGWVRDDVTFSERYYVTDLQRANLVIRTVGFNNGTYTDAQLREVMEEAAIELGDVPLP